MASINIKDGAEVLQTVAKYLAPVGYDETQLTAPGVTTTRSFDGYSKLTCTFTVALINTNVIVRMEGRATSTSDWINLDASGLDTTLTANGTDGFTWEGTLESVRFNWVSESGGTTATINVALRFA